MYKLLYNNILKYFIEHIKYDCGLVNSTALLKFVFLIANFFLKIECYKWMFLIARAGQSQTSMMPFSLAELVTLSRCLRDACLGIIKLAYPETKTEHKEEYVAAFRSVGVKSNSQVQQHIQAQQKRWVQLFKVIHSIPTSHNLIS